MGGLDALLAAARTHCGQDASSRESQLAVKQLLEAVEFPSHQSPIPEIADLSESQRAAVEVLAEADGQLPVQPWAVPIRGWAVRRWLGVDPPGVLERVLTHSHEGTEYTEPLWRALERYGRRMNKRFGSLGLSIADRLEAYVDIALGAYRLPRARLAWGALAEVPSDCGRWAASAADRVVTTRHGSTPMELRWAVFLPLVRAEIPVEPRWDSLLPSGHGDERRAMTDCVHAIAESRREPALLGAVRRQSFGSAVVGCGLEMLETFPSAGLTELVWSKREEAASAPKTSRITVRETEARLKTIAEDHPVVAEALARLRQGLPAVRPLTVAPTERPQSADDLGPQRRAQVERAGVLYDGQSLSTDIRLSANPEDEDTSFQGSLEIHVLLDEEEQAVYDVLEYRGDTGVVYETGTTTVVAEIIQMGMEGADPSVRTAIREALRAARG